MAKKTATNERRGAEKRTKTEPAPTAEVSEVIEVAPEDLVPTFAISTDQAMLRLQELQEFVDKVMIKNIDYGIIPGTPKPTLLKAGAEKLCDIYGFAKEVEVTQRVENWETGLFSYEVRVTLISKRTGQIEAEGIGEANSRERRYQRTIEKTGGAYSLVNTILKMAKKRALVDAALSATRTSGMFTQDVEDLGLTPETDMQNPRKTAPSGGITERQEKYINILLEQKGRSDEEYRQDIQRLYNANETHNLTKDQAKEIIDRLLRMPDAQMA